MPKIALRLEYLLIAAYVLVLSVLAFSFNGTGDDGDSLHHFLYARDAFKYPENFFNHWAKPIYVMLMAPWAQFGFVGVKLANVACLALSMFFTVQIADLMGLKPRYLPLLFIIAAPIAVFWVLSGLTEPLFVCWLTFGVLLAFQHRPLFSTVWLSFLPFVRSEGLVILVVFALYLLLKKHWKMLPLLATGHVVLGIAGYPVHRDFLWVLNRIPYATLDSSSGYGVGSWTHYLVHFDEVYGVFVTWFLAAALLYGLYRWVLFLRGKTPFSKEELWLVYGVFVAYFVAHTIFWAKGMFKSYGLMRVMLGVIPMVALICGRLAEHLISLFNRKFYQWALAILYLAGATWGMIYQQNWLVHLSWSGSQIAHEALAEKYGDTLKKGGYTFYFDAVHPAVALNVDIFGNNKKLTTRLFDGSPVPARSAVIWDNRYSVVDAHTPLSKLREDPRLVLVDSFLDYDKYGVYLFLTTDDYAQRATILVKDDFENSDMEGVVPAPGGRAGQVFQLDRQHQYSRGLSAPVADFMGREKVRLSFDGYALQSPHNETVLVVSYETKVGAILEYQPQPVAQYGFQADRWNSISRDLLIETEKYPDAELKIYLWNPTEVPLYLDNFKIEFVD